MIIPWSLARTKFSKPEKENTRTDFDSGWSTHQYYFELCQLKTPKTSYMVNVTHTVGSVEQNTNLPLHGKS